MSIILKDRSRKSEDGRLKSEAGSRKSGEKILRTSDFRLQRSLGDYSVRVPPLPIPNREVKPDSADGTAKVGE